MAKIRTVKPELWSDEDFMDLSQPARLLFIALLNFADDHGLLNDKPRTLAARCLPGDDIDAEGLIAELCASRFLVRCTAPDGTKLLWIRTFEAHQRIDKRTKGRWGDPLEWSTPPTIPAQSPQIPTDPAESPQIPAEKVRDTKHLVDEGADPIPCISSASPTFPTTEGNGREGKGMEGSAVLKVVDSEIDVIQPSSPATHVDKSAVEEAFEAFWQNFPSIRRRDKPKARAAFVRALKRADIEVIAEGYAKWIEAWAVDDEFAPMPTTWLNGDRWNDDPEPQRNSATPRKTAPGMDRLKERAGGQQ